MQQRNGNFWSKHHENAQDIDKGNANHVQTQHLIQLSVQCKKLPTKNASMY